MHGARAGDRDPGLGARHQREDRLPRAVRRKRGAALERGAHHVGRERALGEEPVEDRVLGGEVDVRVKHVTRSCALLVGVDERIDQALPSDAGHLEEERVERAPVVVEEAGRLTERLRDGARREIFAPEHRALLQEIADERGRILAGDRSHEERAE
jgi:hypothetical protein